MLTETCQTDSYYSHMSQNIEGKFPVDSQFLKCLHNQFISNLDSKVDKSQFKIMYNEFKQKNEQIRKAEVMLFLQKQFDKFIQEDDLESSHLIKTIDSLFKLQNVAFRDVQESKHKVDVINQFIVKTLKTRYETTRVSHKLSKEYNIQNNDLNDQIKDLKQQLKKSEKERQIYLQQIELLNNEINEQNSRIDKFRKESDLMQYNLEKNLTPCQSKSLLLDEKTTYQLTVKEKDLKIDTLKTKKKKLKFQLNDLQQKYDILNKNYNVYQQENIKSFSAYQQAQEKLKVSLEHNKSLEKQMNHFNRQNNNNINNGQLQQTIQNQQDKIDFQQKALHSFSLQKDQLLKDVSQSFVNYHKQKIQEKLDINNLKQFEYNISAKKSSVSQRLSELNQSRNLLSQSHHYRNISPDKTMEKSFLNTSINENLYPQSQHSFYKPRLQSTTTHQNREQMSKLFKNLSFKNDINYGLITNKNKNNRYKIF